MRNCGESQVDEVEDFPPEQLVHSLPLFRAAKHGQLTPQLCAPVRRLLPRQPRHVALGDAETASARFKLTAATRRADVGTVPLVLTPLTVTEEVTGQMVGKLVIVRDGAIPGVVMEELGHSGLRVEGKEEPGFEFLEVPRFVENGHHPRGVYSV